MSATHSYGIEHRVSSAHKNNERANALLIPVVCAFIDEVSVGWCLGLGPFEYLTRVLWLIENFEDFSCSLRLLGRQEYNRVWLLIIDWLFCFKINR